jgi:hypothetical protein
VRRWGLLLQARAWQEAKGEVQELAEGRARAAARRRAVDVGVQATSGMEGDEDDDASLSPLQQQQQRRQRAGHRCGGLYDENESSGFEVEELREQLAVETQRVKTLETRLDGERRKAARAEAAAAAAREEMAAAKARWEKERAKALAELVREREARLGLLEEQEAAQAAVRRLERRQLEQAEDAAVAKESRRRKQQQQQDDDERLTTDEAARLVARAVEEARADWEAADGKKLRQARRELEKERARAAETAEAEYAARLGEIGRKVKQLQGALTKLSG